MQNPEPGPLKRTTNQINFKECILGGAARSRVVSLCIGIQLRMRMRNLKQLPLATRTLIIPGIMISIFESLIQFVIALGLETGKYNYVASYSLINSVAY